MNIKFIHCADVHLGSPLLAASKERQDLLNNAIEDALKNMVDLAINEEVDFVVIAGDLFDGKMTNASIGRKFKSIMNPLEEKKIYTYVLFGNHDAEGKHSLSFSNSEYMKFFSADNAETFKIEEKKIAIHGQSFKTQSVTDNLAKQYPQKLDGYFNIGVLHTSLNGRVGHDNYAPCIINDLENKSYDYWALGHIHKREIVKDANPTIIYSGNIQGRHSKENEEKGCFLVQIDENHRITPEFKKLNKVEFLDIKVDIEDIDTEDKLKIKITENLPIIESECFLKLTLKGKTELRYKINVENIKLFLPTNIELIKFKNETTFPKSEDEIAQMQDTIGTLMKCFEKQEVENEIELLKQNIFISLIDKYDEDLKNELKNEININDPKYLKELVLEQLSKAMK
ncbi:DNA repair exonuclease [Aliarcobacter cryaerophilus]|uniref:metallophosphoesterase family protein n=1 Tax=Aliarcobacter cryaerophilus TaxID=28198 RepID=UPI0021B336B2|nr:DNA repair exonuclease [Aliarcobacter cryaerophilus]MCT7464581.1 DNA repair exonuclease [Aliarcobacter cryaerophilus]